MSNISALPESDSHIDHAASIEYWNSIAPDMNGMLGGFPQISRIDLRGSANFLSKLQRLFPSIRRGKLGRGVDCGAGIGRVTEGFLSNVCAVVDIVEPVEKFVDEVRNGRLNAEGKIGEIYTVGLENWVPSHKYDLIWNQWCVGHLTDNQLVDFLKRCKEALTETGLVVIKENMSTDPEGQDAFDEIDSSVTRTDGKFRSLFQKAGLKLLRSEEQIGFPRQLQLLPVRLYALRPEP
jgi:protein N-terminal methyltransferase